jgi:hypothetical protein
MAEEQKEKTTSILDAAKVAVSAVTEKVVELKGDLMSDEKKEIAGEFKDSNLSKAQQIMQEIPNSMALISKSGYLFKGISVTLGLPPDITATFHYSKDITEDERKALLEEAKDKRITHIVLKCLFKAGDFSHSVKMKDYKLDDVNVTLGLMPGVTVNFVKEK